VEHYEKKEIISIIIDADDFISGGGMLFTRN
jgi:hypothetical protein